jgi:4-amino-4-deoxy-L-arabinose transferase-like glycosyltransferase
MLEIPAVGRESTGGGTVQPPALAWRSVIPAMAALAVVLTAASNRYGFERDELYFRMLSPAWGYVDQPPLTPLLARLTGQLAPSSAWATRIPATLCAVAAVLVLALITRELGGDGRAQALCVWAVGFASFPLTFGHVLLTSSPDLVIWPLFCLFVIRAVLRERGGWWLAAGATAGLGTYNKWLIVMLVVALLVGILMAGPRRVLVSRPVLLAAGLGVLLAVPNLVYQATHSWPQLTMGQALSDNNGGAVRVQLWPFLLLLLGPPLVPIWIAGLVALCRRPQWRRLQFVAVGFVVLVLETFAAASQPYYPFGLLVVVFAAGCVPTAEYLRRSRFWRWMTPVGVALNAAVSAVIALPVIPLAHLADSPVPAINLTVADQIGWPEYVGQLARVYRSLPAAQRAAAAVIASNYGEAGAVTRYGPALGLPHPFSGQNQLYFDARPADGIRTVLIMGGQLESVRNRFSSCSVAARLHNRAGVDNEEEGAPIAICHAPIGTWSRLWPRFQHYD